MIMTRENRKTPRSTRPSATFATTYPTRTDLGPNQVLRGNRPATNLLTHRTARILRRKMTNRTGRLGLHRAVNVLLFSYQQSVKMGK